MFVTSNVAYNEVLRSELEELATAKNLLLGGLTPMNSFLDALMRTCPSKITTEDVGFDTQEVSEFLGSYKLKPAKDCEERYA